MRDHVTKNLLSVVVELAERNELLEAQLEAAAFVQRNLDAMTGKCADLETQNDRLHREYAALLLRFEEGQAKVSELTQELLKRDEE